MSRHPCPICGFKTLEQRGEHDCCLVCGWEDDVRRISADSISPANGDLAASVGQANYRIFRVANPRVVPFIFPPGETARVDVPLFPEAQDLILRHQTNGIPGFDVTDVLRSDLFQIVQDTLSNGKSHSRQCAAKLLSHFPQSLLEVQECLRLYTADADRIVRGICVAHSS